MSINIAEKLSKIPKAELHLHLEACLQPELLLRFAERNKIELPYADLDAVRKAYSWDNLIEFLDMYYMHIGSLVKSQDFYELAYDYVRVAAGEGVKHFEVFFDPQAHTRRGVPFAEMFSGFSEGIRDGKKDFGLSGSLLMSFLRDMPEEDAIVTLQTALDEKADILGVGLDSAEIGNPPSKFERVYEMARAEGLHSVVHAGEEAPPEYVFEALDLLKAERIDHGVRSIESEELIKVLVEREIPLTTCPVSNVCIGTFKSIEDHSAIPLLRKGVKVTINADGPAYFGGYVNHNFLSVIKAFPDMTWRELKQLSLNSFGAAFISEAEKREYYEKVDQAFNDVPLDGLIC